MLMVPDDIWLKEKVDIRSDNTIDAFTVSKSVQCLSWITAVALTKKKVSYITSA